MKNLLRNMAVLFVLFWSFAFAEAITVYKSPTCGCCQEWVGLMESAGHNVTVEHPVNLDHTKLQLGVPKALGSCHTAVINGYLFEGHIPEVDIAAFLANPPAGARGLAVPGMPANSPGMAAQGQAYQGFKVIGFDKQGRYSLVRQY
jgi:hypothetical protein